MFYLKKINVHTGMSLKSSSSIVIRAVFSCVNHSHGFSLPQRE
jgi:hypothetical protein